MDQSNSGDGSEDSTFVHELEGVFVIPPVENRRSGGRVGEVHVEGGVVALLKDGGVGARAGMGVRRGGGGKETRTEGRWQEKAGEERKFHWEKWIAGISRSEASGA